METLEWKQGILSDSALFGQSSNPTCNGKMRDELLNREIFIILTEATILIEQWRKGYNQVRPHSLLGYRPPAPEAIMSEKLT